MPVRGDSLIRISRTTNDALNVVAKKVPRFSAAGLADALLSEACAALNGKGSFELPTLVYLADLLHVKRTTDDTMETRLQRLELLLPAQRTEMESMVLNEATTVTPPVRPPKTIASHLNEMPKQTRPFDPRPEPQPAPRGNTG